MQVKIDSVVLAPGGRAGPSGLSMRCSRSDQIRRAVRAAEVTVFNRKNLMTVVSFRVYRVHADAAAAAAFMIDHAAAANRVGLIEFRQGSAVRTMTGSCVVESAALIGRSTVFDYTLTGGALS